MAHSSDLFQSRRRSNSMALAAFQITKSERRKSELSTVREGSSPTTVFTIGYERRDGEELVGRLREYGIDVLVDVRERPFSRKPDFRRNALEQRCAESGIEYQSWTRLGSTASQREIHASGDLSTFMSRFRTFAKRGRGDELDALAELAKRSTIALICYERAHAECHRCVVSELLADRLDATIVAIE